jgi:peptidoglycan/xylan/chitin deacetylase (PgdA/CDA1 family)
LTLVNSGCGGDNWLSAGDLLGCGAERTMSGSTTVKAGLRALLHHAIIGNFRWQPCGELYTRVRVEEKVAALTFDDGPLPPYTDQLLHTLDELDVRATFFFVGERVLLHPDAARRVVAAGHEVGNHSYSHPRMYYQRMAYLRDQIEVTDRLLRGIGVRGEIPFRAPYGESLFALPWLLWRTRRRHVLFEFFPDPPDWHGTAPEVVAESVARQTRPGSIIVLHDGNPAAGAHVAETTRRLVAKLRRRGFRLTSFADLLSQAEGQAS